MKSERVRKMARLAENFVAKTTCDRVCQGVNCQKIPFEVVEIQKELTSTKMLVAFGKTSDLEKGLGATVEYEFEKGIYWN